MIKNLKAGFLIVLAIALFFGCKKEQGKNTTGSLPQTLTAASVPDGMVMTPQGLMPKANVHLVENGYHLEISGNHVLKIETATGKINEDFGAIKVASPTQVVAPNNAKVSNNPVAKNGSSRALTSAPNGSGWMTYAEYNVNATTPVGLCQSTWTAPVNPGTTGAQIYIGNGVENGPHSNSAANLVIEPALLWGNNGAAGTGNFWTISNWCAWGTGAAYTTPITVTAGTSLTGIVTLTNYVSPNYQYTCAFNGESNTLNVLYNSTQNVTGTPLPAIPIENYAFESLQAYNLTAFGEYPAQSAVNMTAIDMETGIAGSGGNLSAPTSLSWLYYTTPQALYGEHTIIGPNATQTNPTPNPGGEVQLWFHYAAPAITITPGTYQTCKGTAVTTSAPVNTGGGGVNYSFSPATPPSGITYNSNGTITATATAAAGTYNFTVTATNTGGSSGANVSIAITAPPVISYTTPDVYTVGGSPATLTPTNTGGAVTGGYSISPALPSGWSFSTSTGVITVNPTAASPQTTYTVTANGACGSSNTTVTITVNTATNISITYEVINTSSNPVTFDILVNGVLVAGPAQTAAQNQPLYLNTTEPASSNATIVFKVLSGTMPGTATLYDQNGGPQAPVIGVNTLTWNGEVLGTPFPTIQIVLDFSH
jgi:hypothetical protein